MNATLALLTPDEINDVLRFVGICERGGGTPAEEADEWRRRILAWQRFFEVEGGRPVNRRAAA
jgi:hypothetical protein